MGAAVGVVAVKCAIGDAYYRRRTDTRDAHPVNWVGGASIQAMVVLADGKSSQASVSVKRKTHPGPVDRGADAAASGDKRPGTCLT